MFDYEAPEKLLDGRVILVTGANRGIGRAIARGFARHRATVILAGRSRAALEAVYDEIESDGSPEPLIQLLDLETAMASQYQEIAVALDAQFGCLHGLVHNAGLLGPRTPIEHYDVAAWTQVMQVNVNAAFEMSRAMLPLLKAAQDSSLLFTSSSVGRRGRAYWGGYAVSKFAIEGLAQVLADELAESSSVRVNCVNPGATRTAMRQSAFPAENPARNPDPESLLPVYLYLMGQDSLGVTGQSLDAQPGKTLPVSG